MIDRCFLCNNDADYVCAFAPQDQRRFRAPSGKVRTFAYGLCEDCQQLPDWAQRCERKIHAELAQADPQRN
jgi:hypothetical protein